MTTVPANPAEPDQGTRLETLERRLEELEARLETVDATLVRHQEGNEGAFDRVEANLRALEQRADEHDWRGHR